MSALTGYQQINSPASGQSVEVPKSYEPDVQGEPIFSTNKPKLTSFPAANPNFVPRGTSRIQIPPQALAYLLGGTTYLSFTVDTRCTASITSTATTDAIGANSMFTYFSGGPTKSAAALIQRITLTASNGEVLSDIANYAGWHNFLLLHAANENYRSTSSCQENAFTALSNSSLFQDNANIKIVTCDAVVSVQIPLALGFFNQKKAFPLWVMKGPLSLSIVWSSVQNSIGLSSNVTIEQLNTGTPGTDNRIFLGDNTYFANLTANPSISWTGSQLALNTSIVEVRPEYIEAQRRQMQRGRLLNYSYNTVLSSTHAAPVSGVHVSGQTVNLGLNCSSLLAVFGYFQQETANNSFYAKPAGSQTYASWGWNLGTTTSNIELFIDGVPLLNFNLLGTTTNLTAPVKDDTYLPLMDAVTTLFSTTGGSMCKRVFNGIADNSGLVTHNNYANQHDHNRIGSTSWMQPGGTSTFSLPPVWTLRKQFMSGSIYSPNAVAWGVSTRTCNDEGVKNNGVKCSQLQINFGGTATHADFLSPEGSHYLFSMFSSSISFDAYGNIYVRR